MHLMENQDISGLFLIFFVLFQTIFRIFGMDLQTASRICIRLHEGMLYDSPADQPYHAAFSSPAGYPALCEVHKPSVPQYS